MLRKIPGIAGVSALAAVGMLTSACVMKDPKISTATVPDAAMARDAMIMIGSEGETTLLNAPPDLCADPRFGRPAVRSRDPGAVTIGCWDGS